MIVEVRFVYCGSLLSEWLMQGDYLKKEAIQNTEKYCLGPFISLPT